MQTQYFERPEGTLAYSDYGGSGQLVLMFPGMGALRSEYRYLAPKLSQAGYRAITVDLRGHGQSSVPWKTYDVPSVGEDILALTEHLNRGATHLICTSKSAASGVWAAVERPDLFQSLILIGAFTRQVKINPIMNGLFWLMMHNPWRVRAWAMYYSTIYPSHKPADFEDYIQQLTENLKQPGRFDAANAYGNASLQPSEERLPQVEVPTMVIMGTKDPDFPDPVAEGRYIAQQTGAKLELIEDVGHYPQTEIPEKTTPLVFDFLKASVPQPALMTTI
jgi:pimeloyl-ACP methyl ester carboxylesterase